MRVLFAAVPVWLLGRLLLSGIRLIVVSHVRYVPRFSPSEKFCQRISQRVFLAVKGLRGHIPIAEVLGIGVEVRELQPICVEAPFDLGVVHAVGRELVHNEPLHFFIPFIPAVDVIASTYAIRQ
uniref:Putative secreted protein n=1 Tax=Ixodes ricinus TaxID=34613 RepID=A0A6B0UNT3_IXORI